MPGSHIHRYIIREILAPTLLCLVIFTLVLILGQAFRLAELVVSKGVSLVDVLVLLSTLMPTFFSISLPLAFLMGIMIGLGRLSADSETVAFKAAGIGLADMAAPVFALAIAFALLTGITGIWGKPWGYEAFARKSFEIARGKATIGFQPRIFMNQFDNLVVYANEVDDRSNRLQGLFIVEKKEDATAWVFADNGTVLSDEANETMILRLQDGVIHRQQAGSSDNYQLIHFRNYDIRPEINATPAAEKRKRVKPKEMATKDLWLGTGARDAQESQAMKAELHLRLSTPLAPLLFVLFGLPFSMQSHRSGRSGGFVMGLIIFLGYYFALSAAITLTKEAAFPPWLTFWATHAAMFIAGLFLLRQSSLERPNPLVVQVDRTMIFLQKRMRRHVNS